MRGTRSENFKNAVIAILFGILAARGVAWRDTFCMYAGAYLIAQIIWVFLTAYDELLRKRRQSRKNHKRMASL